MDFISLMVTATGCYRAYPKEEQEQVTIALADGVANPGAEVIIGLHAAVCHGAVLRSQRPHNFAAHAELAPVACPQRRRVELPAAQGTLRKPLSQCQKS